MFCTEMLDLWPSSFRTLSESDYQAIYRSVEPAAQQLASQQSLSASQAANLLSLYIPLAAWLDQFCACAKMVPVMGINGAQGSGKSTATLYLQLILQQAFDRRVCGLSIDDIYKTKAERQAMAQEVHPLFATRGVPGTHDIELGYDLISALQHAGANDKTWITRFDKANDDRCRTEDYDVHQGPVDLVLLEGWCVGAVAQTDDALSKAINALEAEEDTERYWRRFVNQQLAEPYQKLFGLIDFLLMLKIPSFAKVYEWRGLQEQKLAASSNANVMSNDSLLRFIMHYERLTRFMLDEMPSRADVVISLGADHKAQHISVNKS